jgi:hypothetical protein
VELVAPSAESRGVATKAARPAAINNPITRNKGFDHLPYKPAFQTLDPEIGKQ